MTQLLISYQVLCWISYSVLRTWWVRGFYISNKKVPSKSAMIKKSQNLLKSQELTTKICANVMLKIVFFCIISGVPLRMASSHLIWAFPLLFLLARSSESVNARCLSDPWSWQIFRKDPFWSMKYGHCPNSFWPRPPIPVKRAPWGIFLESISFFSYGRHDIRSETIRIKIISIRRLTAATLALATRRT